MEQLTKEKPLFALMNDPIKLGAAVMSMESTTPAEKRQKAHWEAKVLMLQGRTTEAIGKLSMALIEFGPHIGLRSDLATCYYLIGMPGLFEKTIIEIKNDYDSFQSLLHPVNQARSALIVGKLFEEAGFLHCTYNMYQDALRLIEQEISNPVWIFDYQALYNRVFAQILRFNVQYGFKDEADSAYSILATARKLDLFTQSNDEILHALFMYSLNAGTMGDRNEFLLKTKDMTPDTINLCFYESVEYDIRKGSQRFLTEYFDLYPPTCAYDQILKSLYLGEESLQDHIRKHCSEISRASLIRSLLLYKLSNNEKVLGDLENLLSSSLKNLSQKDRDIWTRWAHIRSANKNIRQVIINKTDLVFNLDGIEKRIDLNKKKLILKFLLAFQKSTELDWDALSLIIWDKEPDSTDYDRIRMLIKRVNDLLHPKEKSFEFKDLKVRCLIQIQGEA